MTSEAIEAMARETWYVNQLICGKQIFGRDWGLGVLGDDGKKKTLRTVAELVTEGLCEPQFAVIDQHINNLQLLRYN